MIKSIFILFFVGLIGFQVSAQEEQLECFSFEQADSLNAIDARKTVVFFHTDWCKFCLQMQATTLRDDEIISLLNTHYRFVSFDPETEEKVVFAGQEFKYVPNGNNTGINEIAIQLATIEGDISYPSLCILNENYEIVFQYNKLLTVESMKTVLERMLEE